MAITQAKLRATFSFRRILIPILIGITFSTISVLTTNFEFSALKNIRIDPYYFSLALVCMVVRDLAYIVRIRILTEKKLRISDAWHVVMLWEFATSVTPSIAGGSVFAFFFVNAEGINLGKSTAIVLVTALLDELFYILCVAVILLVYGKQVMLIGSDFNFDPMLFFLIGYGVIILFTSSILLGIFVAPQGLKYLLTKTFSISFLKRWRPKAEKTGDEIIISSKELKGKSILFWLKAFIATSFSWTARYLVLNCLILALNPSLGFHLQQQVIIYAKQLIMWVILLISPTPGASGVAEMLFPAFFAGEFAANTHAAVAVLWRGISYYPYLFIGLIILPIWLAKLEKRKKQKKNLEI